MSTFEVRPFVGNPLKTVSKLYRVKDGIAETLTLTGKIEGSVPIAGAHISLDGAGAVRLGVGTITITSTNQTSLTWEHVPDAKTVRQTLQDLAKVGAAKPEQSEMMLAESGSNTSFQANRTESQARLAAVEEQTAQNPTAMNFSWEKVKNEVTSLPHNVYRVTGKNGDFQSSRSDQLAFEEFQFKRHTESFEVSLPNDVVWSIITYTPKWHFWIDVFGGNPNIEYTNSMGLSTFPDEFAPGHAITKPTNATETEDFARVVDAKTDEFLRIRLLPYGLYTNWSRLDERGIFLDFRLATRGRSRTKVSVTFTNANGKNARNALSRFMSKKVGLESAPTNETKNVTLFVARSLRFFCNAYLAGVPLEDIDILSNVEGPDWVTWKGPSGTLHIYENSERENTLNLGDKFKLGEKIGYVFNPDVHSSVEEAQDSSFVTVSSLGRLKLAFASHGERVKTYDRLFLFRGDDEKT